MKKIIFIFMMAFVPMFMFGETNSNVLEKAANSVGDATSTVYGDAKEFLADTYPEVKEAIISIAHAIGVAAEHVYTVLVKKYFVDGLTELFILIIGLVLLIIGWVKLDKYVNKRQVIKKDDGSEMMAPIDWHILYPLFILIGGIITTLNVNFHDMFLNLVNPEWGAINYILNFTKTMVH